MCVGGVYVCMCVCVCVYVCVSRLHTHTHTHTHMTRLLQVFRRRGPQLLSVSRVWFSFD